jgi:hypothetical protein
MHLINEHSQEYWSQQPIDKWGPIWWKEAEEWADKIPCPTCKPMGQKMVSGFQDIVNIKKGERPEQPENLLFLQKTINEAVEKCHSLGHCSGSRKGHGRTISLAHTPVCSSSKAKKWERCINKVKDREGIVSPYAVCTTSLGCHPKR